jgi:hypothetical protein
MTISAVILAVAIVLSVTLNGFYFSIQSISWQDLGNKEESQRQKKRVERAKRLRLEKLKEI